MAFCRHFLEVLLSSLCPGPHTSQKMLRLSVSVAFITIFFFASRARALALDDRLCDARGVSPTPAPGVLLTDEEHAKFTRMIAAIDVSEPYPASNFTKGVMMGEVEGNGEGGLLTRQYTCVNPGWILLCPGPLPCCPPSNTVCCPGGCCPTGDTCVAGGCCPRGYSLCADGISCCRSGSQCCAGRCCLGLCCGSQCCSSTGSKCCGSHCCESGASCCGSSCCRSGTTCCGTSNCCTSSERCENGRCSNPNNSGSEESEDPEPPEVEVEITVQPSDPQIQYDPPSAWSSTGGSCTNGTRTTTQVEAKITYKFKGMELSFDFVPKDADVSVTVELNGVTIDEFVIPGEASSLCQQQHSWKQTFSLSTNEQQISFIYNGPTAPSIGRRATPALELKQIRYVPNPQESQGNHASSQTTVPILMITASVTIMVLVGIHFA